MHREARPGLSVDVGRLLAVRIQRHVVALEIHHARRVAAIVALDEMKNRPDRLDRAVALDNDHVEQAVVRQFAQPAEIVGQFPERVFQDRRRFLRNVGKQPTTKHVDEVFVVGAPQIHGSDLPVQDPATGFRQIGRHSEHMGEIVGRPGRKHRHRNVEPAPLHHVHHVIDRSVAAGDQRVVVALIDPVEHVGLLGIPETKPVRHDRITVPLVNLDDVVEPLRNHGFSGLGIINESDFLHLFSRF